MSFLFSIDSLIIRLVLTAPSIALVSATSEREESPLVAT